MTTEKTTKQRHKQKRKNEPLRLRQIQAACSAEERLLKKEQLYRLLTAAKGL